MLNVAARLVRHSMRNPIFVLFTIIQPLIWLLLFGQLFGGVAELPGLEDGEYTTFLTPGVVVMTALFGSIYSGMYVIRDLNSGVFQRQFATSLSRFALATGYTLHAVVLTLAQCTAIVMVALVIGATPGLGIPGLLIALAAGMLLSLGVGGVSNALALVLRNEQAVFSILNFFSLPMTFLSSVLIARTAMPQWIQYVAAFNPIDWAVSVARYGYYPTPQPSFAAVALLSLFALVGLLVGWFSVRVYSE